MCLLSFVCGAVEEEDKSNKKREDQHEKQHKE
jgi:hypothetical protein